MRFKTFVSAWLTLVLALSGATLRAADTPAIVFGGEQFLGPSANASAEGQVFVGSPQAGSNPASSSFHAGLRIFNADPLNAVNPTFGPNFKAGCPTNFIDPACASCTIVGGGRPSWENKILHTSGQGTGTEYTCIAGGYDIIVTDTWPGLHCGAHNRGNTPTSQSDSAYDPGVNSAGTITSSGMTVTGTGTTFTTLKQGSAIKAGGNWYYVDSVASATSLTLKSAPSPALTNATYRVCQWQRPNDGYVPSNSTDHISIIGATYTQIGNSHYGTVCGGTQTTMGYTGAAQVSSNAAFGGGGSGNVICGDYSGGIAGTDNFINCLGGFVGAGSRNTLTGNYSFATGDQNIVAGPRCFTAGGNNNISATSDWSATLGFQNTVTAGRFNILVGRENTGGVEGGFAAGYRCRNNTPWQISRASGSFTTQGDAQASHMMARATSTSSAATQLWINGADSSGGLMLIHSSANLNYTAANMTIKVVAIGKTSMDSARWNVDRLAIRGASAATLIFAEGDVANMAPTSSYGQGSNLRLSASLDTSNGSLKVFMSGVDAMNFRVVTDVYKLEVSNP